MLALGQMLNEHTAGGAGPSGRRPDAHHVLDRGLSEDAQPVVFPAALIVAALRGARCLPLVEAVPAEVEPLTLVFGADAADDPFVFAVDALAERVAPGTLLDAHRLSQVVFRDLGLELLLLVCGEDCEPPHLNVGPLAVAADLVLPVDVGAEEYELAGGEQALAVGGERLGVYGMAARHFGPFTLRIIVPRDHVWFVCQIHQVIQGLGGRVLT